MGTESKKISDRIMIVRLSIHQWRPTKFDKKATADIAAVHNIDPERAGSFMKNLIPKSSILPLQQCCRKLRENVHQMTAPWEDGGLRALPADLYYEFCEELRNGIQEIDSLADDFAKDYDVQREKARTELHGLFNEDDYPPAHIVRNKFAVEYDFKPVANPDDVRVWGLSDDAQQEIEKQVRESVTAQVEAAQWHVMSQVIERAKEYIDKVRKFDEQVNESESGKGLRLYDSALSNLRDVILLVLSGLNFSGDQEIEALCKELKSALRGVNIVKLKNSQPTREKSTDAIEKVLAKFEGVYGS